MNIKAIGLSLLAGACALPAVAVAQDATGPAGAWFGSQPGNPSIWVFHEDGTVEGFDAAFAGVLVMGPEPRRIGAQTSWHGNWKQLEDGSVHGYVIKMSADGPDAELPGRLSTIFQATINFTPGDGTLMYCVEMMNFAGKNYDPATNDPSNLPQVDTCTAEFGGLAVVTVPLKRLPS